MTTKNLFDDLSHRIVNDRDIFPMYQVIFDQREWTELKKVFEERKTENWHSMFVQKKNDRRISADNYHKVKQRLESLENAYINRIFILSEIFDLLDEYGLVYCNLPKMEQYGQVIEVNDRETVKLFMLDKIKKQKYRDRKALSKVYDYILELYDHDMDRVQIAYMVRKFNSYKIYWEVL